jgi:hypothetical protein
VLYFPTFFAFAHRAFCAPAIRARRAALIFRLPGETGRIYFARLHPLNLFVDALKNRPRSLRVAWPGRVHAGPEAFHGSAGREGNLTYAVEGGNHPQDSVDIERFAGRLSGSRRLYWRGEASRGVAVLIEYGGEGGRDYMFTNNENAWNWFGRHISPLSANFSMSSKSASKEDSLQAFRIISADRKTPGMWK